MKKILNYVGAFFCMLLILIMLLTLSCMIPQKYLEEHTKETASILNKESNVLPVKIAYKNLRLMFNNYTDALMVNTAYSIDSKTSFYSAMVARKNYIPDITQTVYPDVVRRIKIFF